jgi:hypothetical protein
MKTATTLLCVALLLFPVEQSRAQAAPAFCIAITAVLVAGAVVVYVQSCAPKYYCVTDPEQSAYQWCAPTTKRECAINGWKINAGPFRKHGDCAAACTNTLPMIETGVLLSIERSTNLVDWEIAAQFVGDPECFEWSETNALPYAAFYRARY